MIRSTTPIAAIALAFLLSAQGAAAQDAPAEPPERIRNVILYGDEQCPQPTSDEEIVVCARGGESPYRIPEGFREREQTGASVSWVRRVEVVEEVNRAGLPNSCSPIGMGGQSGCTRQMIQQWAQDRLDQRRRESLVP